jgi:outer membrane protein assembly factor BamA
LKRGFLAAQVTSRIEPRARIAGGAGAGDGSSTTGARIVVLSIAEGRRSVTRVEIAGLPPDVPLAAARARVALEDGAGFDYESYQAARQPLAVLVQNAGYAHAEVGSAMVADPAGGTVTARYQITPGVRCTFGNVKMPALPGSLAAAVRARLRFATGDRYSFAALEATQAELYALGRFSTVQVVADRGSADQRVVDVTVEVVQSSRHELQAGGGVGYEPTTFEVHGRGGYSGVPAALPLLTVTTAVRAALTIPHGFDSEQLQPRIRGLFSVQYLDLLLPRLRGDIELGLDYQTIEAYTWTGEHARLGLGMPLGVRWLQLSVGWLIEQVQFSSPDAALDPATQHELRLDRDQRRGAYQASLVADLRDNAIEPHRGAYIDLRAERGTRYALSDLTYLQLTPELRGYVSLGGTVVAARARVGMIFGDVPVTERYYSGGISQRGFAYRRLSPLATNTVDGAPRSVVIGGAGLIETGIELRRRLGTLWSFPAGASVFLDGGDVTERPGQLDPSALYWAAGVGGWGKVVGDLKFRIDLGYRLNDRGPDDPLHTTRWRDHIQYHIGIGEAF